jgi:DNA-binding IclR family transcriptional regulator
LRTRRREFFDAELFSDPAWDILLMLANAPERTGFGVAQIADSLGHPLSVTDRWLKILASKGQVEIAGQDGGANPLYRIADRAFEALVNVFAGICERAPDQTAD